MKWKTLRLARSVDEAINFEAHLYLDRVPLTDHVEWTVWIERIKPNNNYSKNFGWFYSEKEAEDCFYDVLNKNTDYMEMLGWSDPHAEITK